MSDIEDFGVNLIWFLDELASAENEMIETGDIEIEVVDKHGFEGFTAISIQDLAGSAAKELNTLQSHIVELESALNRISNLTNNFHVINAKQIADQALGNGKKQ